ncbi:MAG: hypothetical protein ACFCU8_06455 [Thermosynechococcaceae cyanobacterium]
MTPDEIQNEIAGLLAVQRGLQEGQLEASSKIDRLGAIAESHLRMSENLLRTQQQQQESMRQQQESITQLKRAVDYLMSKDGQD